LVLAAAEEATRFSRCLGFSNTQQSLLSVPGTSRLFDITWALGRVVWEIHLSVFASEKGMMASMGLLESYHVSAEPDQSPLCVQKTHFQADVLFAQGAIFDSKLR
jgi:hypothetical protein